MAGWHHQLDAHRLVLRIIADGDCSREIRRRLLLESFRKALTNLDRELKSRDIALPTKVGIVKAVAFPAVMHGCEGWTVEKAACQRIDGFELRCWRRLKAGGEGDDRG